eukprot:14702255-Alexandrium_andersonii.AAC.1
MNLPSHAIESSRTFAHLRASLPLCGAITLLRQCNIHVHGVGRGPHEGLVFIQYCAQPVQHVVGCAA